MIEAFDRSLQERSSHKSLKEASVLYALVAANKSVLAGSNNFHPQYALICRLTQLKKQHLGNTNPNDKYASGQELTVTSSHQPLWEPSTCIKSTLASKTLDLDSLRTAGI